MKIRKKVASICKITGTALLVLVILLCLPVTLPRLAGFQIYTVISGSMEPEIPVGSLVYIQPAAPEEVEEGEVIAYYSPVDAGAIITHRVMENHVVSGEFITKGDANENVDMLPAPYDNLIGRLTLAVPKAGTVMEALTTTRGKTAAACMIVLFVLLHGIAALLGKGTEKEK